MNESRAFAHSSDIQGVLACNVVITWEEKYNNVRKFHLLGIYQKTFEKWNSKSQSKKPAMIVRHGRSHDSFLDRRKTLFLKAELQPLGGTMFLTLTCSPAGGAWRLRKPIWAKPKFTYQDVFGISPEICRLKSLIFKSEHSKVGL